MSNGAIVIVLLLQGLTIHILIVLINNECYLTRITLQSHGPKFILSLTYKKKNPIESKYSKLKKKISILGIFLSHFTSIIHYQYSICQVVLKNIYI